MKDASEVGRSGAIGGVMFGRRQPLGPIVLIGGARAAAFSAEVELAGASASKDMKRDNHRHDEFLDPRVGLYAGCMLSETSRLRVRMQVDGDAGVLVHRTELADMQAFPRWNLGVSLGAEAGFLP